MTTELLQDIEQVLEQERQRASALGLSSGFLASSRAVAVGGTAEADAASLLPLAKKRAIDPTVFDEVPPFFFSGIATNMNWDSYDTRMGTTSLQNYAADFTTGVAYLVGHDTRSLQVGGTLVGTFEQVNKSKAQVRADVYMLQNSSSEDLRQKIRAGIAKDQSISFYPGENGQYICSICNRDMLAWRTDKDPCMHMLGMTYQPTDKTGKPKGDGQPIRARATVEDHHAAELSSVYDGSTPGAMIDKARSLANQGQMDYDTRDFIRVRYHIALPGGSRIHPVAQRDKRTMLTEEEIAALISERDNSVRENTRLTTENTRLSGLVDNHARTTSDTRALLAPVLPSDHAGQADMVSAVRFLTEERAKHAPLVEDGRAYRVDLINTALAEGARAMGASFKADVYKPSLEAMPIPAIRQFIQDWKELGDKTFPKGRQTTDNDGTAGTGTQTQGTTPKVLADNAAYRG